MWPMCWLSDWPGPWLDAWLAGHPHASVLVSITTLRFGPSELLCHLIFQVLPAKGERERERNKIEHLVGCPYGWLTGRGDDLALPACLGRLAPPLCACLHSLLLESGPWPLFILGIPTNRERERGRWALRERQRGAEGKREREERETGGMRPDLL